MPATAVLSPEELQALLVPDGPVPPGSSTAAGPAGDDGTGALTSVDKALAVLEAFRGPGTILGVTEVARRGCLSKSTAHRMLGLLVDRGYVEREGSRYVLGPMLFELGNSASYARARTLRAIAMPYMIELLQSASATVHLTAIVDGDLLFLERVYGHQGVRSVPSVGSRIPAAGTAPGEVVRAFSGGAFDNEHEARRMAQIRRRGVAYQNGGVGQSTISIAAPVVARSTRLAVAALSVVLRRNQHRAPTLEADLHRCASRIAEDL
jgi:DNA-binding IclR family transcriptional regulator